MSQSYNCGHEIIDPTELYCPKGCKDFSNIKIDEEKVDNKTIPKPTELLPENSKMFTPKEVNHLIDTRLSEIDESINNFKKQIPILVYEAIDNYKSDNKHKKIDKIKAKIKKYNQFLSGLGIGSIVNVIYNLTVYFRNK